LLLDQVLCPGLLDIQQRRHNCITIAERKVQRAKLNHAEAKVVWAEARRDALITAERTGSAPEEKLLTGLRGNTFEEWITAAEAELVRLTQEKNILLQLQIPMQMQGAGSASSDLSAPKEPLDDVTPVHWLDMLKLPTMEDPEPVGSEQIKVPIWLGDILKRVLPDNHYLLDSKLKIELEPFIIDGQHPYSKTINKAGIPRRPARDTNEPPKPYFLLYNIGEETDTTQNFEE
jgi:hypothetical protein